MNSKKYLHFLGTGHAHVTRCYNTCFLINIDDHLFLTDAGGGNQILYQLEKSNISLTDIHHMFISHSHTDHILGAIWVIRLYGTSITKGNLQPLHIYGNKDVIQKIRCICEALIQPSYIEFFDNQIIFHVLKDKDTLKLWNCKFTFFDIKCVTTPQLGYELVFTNKKRLVFCGDEPFRLKPFDYIKDADWVIYENTTVYYDEEFAHIHSSTKEGCILAEKADIKNFILTHTEDFKLKTRKNTICSLGKQFFSGNLYCPDDFDTIFLE